MPKKMVRIGVIGCGLIAREAHLPNIMQIPEAKLTAVCDVVKSRAQKIAKKFGVKKWYADYLELVKDPNVDLVDICTPHVFHHPQAIAATEEGKHILCEKPLGRTYQEAKEMVEAAKKAGVKMMTGYQTRFFPVNLKIKEILDKGLLGSLYYYKYFAGQKGSTWAEWFYDPKLSGGVGTDIGCYAADEMRWFIGEAKTVYGSGECFWKEREIETLEGKHVSLKDLTLQDFFRMTVKFENGIFGDTVSSFCTVPPYESVEIFGNKGIIRSSRQEIWLHTEQVEIPEFIRGWVNVRVPPTRENPHMSKIKHIIECVLEDKEPSPSGYDGMKAMEIVEAAQRSIETSEPVNLPL